MVRGSRGIVSYGDDDPITVTFKSLYDPGHWQYALEARHLAGKPKIRPGWQVLGRVSGADGDTVSDYFEHPADALKMVERMKLAVPAELSNWAGMTIRRDRSH